MGKIIGMGAKTAKGAPESAIKVENKKLKEQLKESEEAKAALIAENEALKAQLKPPEDAK